MRKRGPMETAATEWYVIGIVMGASVTATIAVLLITLDWHEGIVGWAREWQTLVTGFMALGGAYLSISWLQRQIDQTREQEADRIERAHFADRATMPAALADIVDYAKQGLAALKLIPKPGPTDLRLEPDKDWTPPQLPRIPTYAVDVIRACIETGDSDAREQMASLLRHLQICDSRLHGLFEEKYVAGSQHIVTVHNMHSNLADFIELYLRSDRMIRYARGETTEIEDPVTLGSMTTRAIVSHLEYYPGLMNALAERFRET